MVFVGSQEGFVWGLDAGTGDMVWKFSCGGGVPVTPSYWRGRVFFGSMDGWVYAVEAKTGNLAWKFRAAPEEHYITLVGRITSSWPVQSGVLVEDGIAYFVGGVCSYDGVYLYGLDGESGKVVLAKEIGHVTPMGQGVSPQGAMISSGEVLLIPNGGDLPVSVRKSDGVVLWWRNTKVELEGLEREMRLASFYNGGGEEILAGDDAFLVGGGHRLGDRGYPFIICDTASGTPYGLIAAYKSGKIKKLAYGMGVFVPAGAASFARRPNPVLAEDLLVTGVRDGIAAYAWKKMTETSLLSKEERIARAELWKTNAPAGANSIVLAGGQILLAGTSDVVAVNKEDRRTLGTLHVEGQVQPNSLTAARGKLFLVTEDGRVLCLNK
jgi:outer membrane protein assembly factor BamB